MTLANADMKTTFSTSRQPIAESGFFLIEALIAMLIFSLGVLALVGFHAASIKHAGDAKQRVNAAFIANEIESGLWTVDSSTLQACSGTYTAGSGSGCGSDWGLRLQGLPNGQANVVINGSQATLTITWRLPGETEDHTYVHYAEILHN